MEETDLGVLPVGKERVSLSRTFGGRSLLRELVETLLLAAMLFGVLNLVMARFQVLGSCMEPALSSGQFLVVSRSAYWLGSPERGDVIVLHPPINPSEEYIKRIVGLPGEWVDVRDGEVWVDGVRLDEPYVATPPAYTDSWRVGEGEYLVLGDNRNNADDSHTWGLLAEEGIIGKAWFCYWPPEGWGVVEHFDFSPVE